MWVSSQHSPQNPVVETALTAPEYVQYLGEVAITLGSTRIHLSKDEADRLLLNLTATLQDLDAQRSETAA